MIIDTSAIVAILRQETDAYVYSEAIAMSSKSLIITPTYLEASMVLASQTSNAGIQRLDTFLRQLNIKIIPYTEEMAVNAARAFLSYGKGQQNQAQLNFGDCMVYSACKVEAMPLLFKGDDFTHTDVERAI
jgi:ribonuclease VapC